MLKIVLLIFAVMSFLSLALFGIDKVKAIRHSWRIPEKTLLLFSFFGGGIGSLLGMLLFRHKIRKAKFFILVPLFLLLQIALIAVIFIYF